MGMTAADALKRDVQQVLDEVVAQAEADTIELGNDPRTIFELMRLFTRGGKRLRAQFLAAGYRSVAENVPMGTDSVVVQAAAALELFHAAALAHDDIIDRSDTRRGAPAAHRAIEAHHRNSGWASDAARFGENAAILFGDLLLVLSDDRFRIACSLLEDASAASRAADEFRRMRTEVALGQYLDIVEEVAWPVTPVTERAERARRVAIAKSARYSVEEPLVIGALLAGADDSAVERIRAFGLPLGLAFQLRDDVLGVFGDPKVTGKPAGDDLREGKRTVLIAAAAAQMSEADARELDRHLGNSGLSPEQVQCLTEAIRKTGALETVESEIETLLSRALTSLDASGFDAESSAGLRSLAERTARRDT